MARVRDQLAQARQVLREAAQGRPSARLGGDFYARSCTTLRAT